MRQRHSIMKFMQVLAAFAICLRVLTICDPAMAATVQSMSDVHCEGMGQAPDAPAHHQLLVQDCAVACPAISPDSEKLFPDLYLPERLYNSPLHGNLCGLRFPPPLPPPRNL
jgi:hypothetical protein